MPTPKKLVSRAFGRSAGQTIVEVGWGPRAWQAAGLARSDTKPSALLSPLTGRETRGAAKTNLGYVRHIDQVKHLVRATYIKKCRSCTYIYRKMCLPHYKYNTALQHLSIGDLRRARRAQPELLVRKLETHKTHKIVDTQPSACVSGTSATLKHSSTFARPRKNHVFHVRELGWFTLPVKHAGTTPHHTASESRKPATVHWVQWRLCAAL